MYKLLGTFCVIAFLGGCSIVPDKPNDPAKKSVNQVLPPEYLNIDGFRSCLATEKKGSARFYCMPEAQPKDCPDKTWEDLNNLKNSEKIPSCSKAMEEN